MSGLDPKQFLQHIIRPALAELGPKFSTVAAEQLLMGTTVQESGLAYLKQIGGGPALGVYQMEPATHDDIWANFLRYRSDLWGTFQKSIPYPVDDLIWDLKYATKMARLHYYRVKDALPAEGDITMMAFYWKRHYNTLAGAGHEKKFRRCFHNLMDKHPDLW